MSFILSIAATALVMHFTDLEKLKSSRFGGYISKHMTLSAQTFRFAGNYVMIVGAWFHILFLILTGLII